MWMRWKDGSRGRSYISREGAAYDDDDDREIMIDDEIQSDPVVLSCSLSVYITHTGSMIIRVGQTRRNAEGGCNA